jgi:YHS domain-containing protein
MRRPPQLRSTFSALLLMLHAGACLASAGVGHAATANLFTMDPMQHVIVDSRTGVALFGYDPVAYHFDQKARQGLPEHQLTLDGRIWWFTSAANKAAFEADPAAYAPMFGGYDGSRVGDGILTKGEPAHFVIAAGQLVLFRSLESRDRFAMDQSVRQKARENWPAVVRQQIGH